MSIQHRRQTTSRIRQVLSRLTWLAALGVGVVSAQEGAVSEEIADPPQLDADTAAPGFSLRDCVAIALVNNRELQIQRLIPQIARATLSGSYGYYDPIFLADTRRESASDTGGFDPTDFSRDAIYTADSVTSRLGFTGVLPTGLSYNIAGSYANSYGWRNGLDFDSYSLYAGIAVQQPLLRDLWIDQGRWTIQVNKKNLRITELGVMYLAMDVINRVQQAYYDLLLARGQLEARQLLLGARQRTVHGLQRKVDQGLLARSEMLSSQTQVALTAADLLVLSNTVHLTENNLRNLLGEDLRTTKGRLQPSERLQSIPEIFDLQESWHRALARRPDLAQLQEDVAKAELGVKFRRNQLFPSLDVVAGYGRRGASTAQLPPPFEASASATDAFEQLADGTAPTEFLGFIFSLPLSRASERAAYRASKELRAQAELLVKQREELILREVADAVSTARTSLERVRAARQATDYARAACEAEERKLAGGTTTVFFVLQVQADLATARSAEIAAHAGYHKAISMLRFAEARNLEDYGLTFEFK